MLHSPFQSFGGNSDPVQLMYGRTAYFKWFAYMYCGIAGKYGCTPVQKLYESRMKSQMLDLPFQSLWWYFGSCTVNVRTYNLF